MQNPRAKGLSRFISAALVLAMVLAALPPFELPVFAEGKTHTFDSGAVYIDSSFNGDVVIIKNGVFSVTVNGAQNVELVFGERTATGTTGVTIDRRHATNPVNDQDAMHNKEVEGLYEVSQKLGATGRAQTCPLLITGNSTVEATFLGQCRFYAGTNACSVDRNDIYTARTGGDSSNRGNGFAGIQVDSGSSLTIEGADDLMVFGGHQFGIPDIDTDGDGKPDSLKYGTGNNATQVRYSDLLRANASIGNHTNPSSIQQYGAPPHAVHLEYSGGAGIGGGPGLTPGTSQDADFNGAAGTIIINGGNIEAYGGQQAAGIGGAVNGAATTGMIQINGGNIIAHGGRWAAGIGDGDTVTSPNTATIFKTSTSIIEINGGTVEAYGGVASSGIGTSDEMTDNKGFGSDYVREMHIYLNGGVIRAYSGFPDNFNGGNFPAEAPAAIGAGSKTLTPANSVYVSSDADLRSGGFGNYALTENGLNSSTVPTIAVDSDGYLLLLQTADYHSTAERALKIYLPLTKTMKVDTNGNHEIDEEDTEMVTYIYTNQQVSGSRYYVALVKDSEGVESKMVFDADGHLVSNAQNLTLYVNTDPTKGETSTELKDLMISFPYYFRSIALTLPHPELYGGIYALEVPVNGVGNVAKPADGSNIILTIDAREQGTQNGTITFPSENNLQSRPVSAPFIDLDVFGSDKLNGLIGDAFYPTVYGYTVYAEPGDSVVDLYMLLATRTDTNYQLSYNNGQQTKTIIGNGERQSWTIENIPLTGSETILRIQKKDVNSGNPDPIAYKITIILKDDLSLTITDPGKEYDGQPANSIATGVVQYPMTYDVKEFETAAGYTETVTMKEVTEYFSGSAYISNRYNSYNNYTYYAATLSYQLHIIPSGNTIYYFLTFDARGSANNQSLTNTSTKYAAGWKITKSGNSGNYGAVSRETSKPSVFGQYITGEYTWLEANDSRQDYRSVTLATGNGTNLSLRVYSSYARLYRGSTQITEILKIAAPATRNTSSGTSRDNAEDAAEAALKDGATHGTFPYDKKTVSGTNQIITMGVPAWETNTQTTEYSLPEIVYPISGTTTYEDQGYFSIIGTPDTSQSSTPVAVPAEDLEKVAYIYYNATTNQVLSLNEGPVDAGEYYVEAVLTTQTYNAKSERVYFTITRRPVEVLRIEKWLTYVTSIPDVAELHFPKTTEGVPDIGYVELGNIVSSDEGKVTFGFKDGGEAYYYDGGDTLKVDYRSDKIVLAQGELQGGQAKNYYLQYADKDNEIIRVYGQLAYYTNSSDGSMFRLDEIGNSWDKYFPVDGDIRVGADGNPADYHSPVYYAHAEYIRARTVNRGENEARYCIDIEYGAMSFGFFRSAWDVNDLEYEKLTGSQWTRMDGSNNKLTIINRSNRAISYTLTLKRASGVSGAKIGFEIKTANVQTGGTVLVGITADNVSEATGSAKRVGAATAGENPGDTGAATTDSCYLIMSGVPQFADGVVTTTGTIGILFKPADDTP